MKIGFRFKSNNYIIPCFEEIQYEVEKEQDKFLQKSVDIMWDGIIKREGQRLFIEWLQKPTHILNCKGYKFHIPLPRTPGMYYLHDKATARYDKVDVNKLIIKEYQKLINEYENKF